MAKKKDFEPTAPVYSTIIGNADPRLYEQEPPKAEDVQEAQEELRTQGRRGYRLQRINLAFTPTNLDYIRTMAKAKGMTQTQFVNQVLDRHREQAGEAFAKIKELLGDL
jgi:hypothetical protein